MLATRVDEPFDQANWVFEEKYDGVRILTYKEGQEVSLISRSGNDRGTRYPKMAAALRELEGGAVALDREAIVRDEKMFRGSNCCSGDGTPQYAVFDCLYADGKDLRKRSSSERRKVLEGGSNRTRLLLAERVAEAAAGADRP